MIPLMLKLRINEKNSRGVNLWFPLFLLWIIVLPLLVLVGPIILLVSLLAWPAGKGRMILFSYLMIFKLIWHMSGLKIDVESNEKIIFINLI